MAVILPKIDDLEAFMVQLRKQHLNKRQEEIAKKVLEQWEELKDFAKDCTETINYSDDYDAKTFNQTMGFGYCGGEG